MAVKNDGKDYSEEQELERLLKSARPFKCKVCGGVLLPHSIGKYKCDHCGNIQFDELGKVKDYLDREGPHTALEIELATGVERKFINYFLRKGRVEITEGSAVYLHCQKCGCAIKSGRFCSDCVKEVAGKMGGMMNEEVGDKPKYNNLGKMRFFETDRK